MNLGELRRKNNKLVREAQKIVNVQRASFEKIIEKEWDLLSEQKKEFKKIKESHLHK